MGIKDSTVPDQYRHSCVPLYKGEKKRKKMLAVSISHISAWPTHSSASAGRGQANQWTEFWPSRTHIEERCKNQALNVKRKKKHCFHRLQREDALSHRPRRYCNICKWKHSILNPALLLFSMPAHSGIPTCRTPRSGIKTKITSVLEKHLATPCWGTVMMERGVRSSTSRLQSSPRCLCSR